MTTEHLLHACLKTVKDLVYDKCGFELTNLKLNSESIEYGACSFKLNGQKIEHRFSKITPAKTGQFVTIWTRNADGITKPYNVLDDFDFVVITSKRGEDIGQFIFPKSILADKGVISQKEKEGKRGIRVYPSWDTVASRQAEKTQNWQLKYFLTIQRDDATDLDLTRKLFGMSDKK